MSKTHALCFIRGSKHLETIKALGLRPYAFICFSVFETPDETLALLFDILHEALVLEAFIHIFLVCHDSSLQTLPIVGGVWACGVKQKPEIPHCLHCRPFCSKAYIICTLLLCNWSVQQTARKPQIQ